MLIQAIPADTPGFDTRTRAILCRKNLVDVGGQIAHSFWCGPPAQSAA